MGNRVWNLWGCYSKSIPGGTIEFNDRFEEGRREDGNDLRECLQGSYFSDFVKRN